MSKPLRIIFCILSIVLVSAMTFACVFVWRNGNENQSGDESKAPATESSAEESVYVEPGEETSPAPESSETVLPNESSEDSLPADSSEDSSEDSVSEDSSVDESTAEDSSEDSSVAESTSEEESTPDEESNVHMGGTDPIIVAPDGITASEFDSYFNDSLFVGHSVMVHFNTRTSSWRTKVSPDILGDALFCCTSSFSFYNNEHQTPETPDNVLPKYRGSAYNIEELPAATGRGTVYLGLMGLNDLGMVGTADNCAQLVAEEVFRCIEAIKTNSPDTKVVVLAATYLTRDKSYTKLNNHNMSLLNNYVLDYCNTNGIDFIDVATPLTDGDGYLASVYSIDSYCHLTERAYYIWMDVLRDYASQKMAGSWKNPTNIPVFE